MIFAHDMIGHKRPHLETVEEGTIEAAFGIRISPQTFPKIDGQLVT